MDYCVFLLGFCIPLSFKWNDSVLFVGFSHSRRATGGIHYPSNTDSGMIMGEVYGGYLLHPGLFYAHFNLKLYET